MQILDAAYGKEALAKEIVVPVEGSATGWVFRAREPLILARLDSGRFPASTYTVTEATPGVLLIRNEKLGSDAAFVQAHSLETTKPQDSGKLIFNRYGDTYFLNQVPSDVSSYSVPKSQNEISLSNELTAENRADAIPVVVVVSLQ